MGSTFYPSTTLKNYSQTIVNSHVQLIMVFSFFYIWVFLYVNIDYDETDEEFPGDGGAELLQCNDCCLSAEFCRERIKDVKWIVSCGVMHTMGLYVSRLRCMYRSLYHIIEIILVVFWAF